MEKLGKSLVVYDLNLFSKCLMCYEVLIRTLELYQENLATYNIELELNLGVDQFGGRV